MTARHTPASKAAATMSSTLPAWLWWTVGLFSAAMLALQFSIYGHGTDAFDGYSYFRAWDTITSLHTDQLRPPVYPIFVGILSDLFGKNATLIIIPIIQWTVYALSMQLVWSLCRSLDVRRGLAIAAVFFFLMFPGMWMHNNVTIPEPLCGSGLLLLAWLTERYIRRGSRKELLWSCALVICLIFTKVMYIFLIQVMAVVWIYVCRRRGALKALTAAAVIVPVVLPLLYSLCNRHTYLHQGLTLASTWNEYYCLRMEGLIRPDDIRDPGLRERVAVLTDADPGRWVPGENIYRSEVEYFNWTELSEIVDDAVAAHPGEVLKMRALYLLRTLPHSSFLIMEPTYDPEARTLQEWNGYTYHPAAGYIYPFHRHIWFPVWVAWLVIILFSISWLRKMQKGDFPLLPFMIAASAAVGYGGILMTAPDDWGRLMTSLNYFLPIMAASAATRFLNPHNV